VEGLREPNTARQGFRGQSVLALNGRLANVVNDGTESAPSDGAQNIAWVAITWQKISVIPGPSGLSM